MSRFVIIGRKKLNGSVTISGSKNAALPILAATLLTDEKCVIKNVPDIEDIHTMLALLSSLGSKSEFKNHTVTIQTDRPSRSEAKPLTRPKGATLKIRHGKVPMDLGCKMRASVLLLGPLLARSGFAHLPYPGGCVLGARPIHTHTNVLAQFGVKKIKSRPDEIIFQGKPKAVNIVLPEFSVTGTENAVMAAALTKGKTEIRMAAVEPHVQDLCRFLQKLGVHIEGIGTHTLVIRGAQKLKGALYSITPDYLEAGTFVIAAILTRGKVTIKNIEPHDLHAFWNLLREMGVKFSLQKNAVIILPSATLNACSRLQTNVFPGFPTDLQPPFAILLTQAKGISHIHETLFEGRFKYFPELIKMGAKIKTVNPHEALINGPTQLYGSHVKSWDIRAGAAMILAALAAKGKTVVSDIQYIDRGYERFDEKLRLLGADIVRED